MKKGEFDKSEINTKYNNQINKILKENHKKRKEWNKCAAIYRDILILKLNNKKVGIIKICFECGKTQFTGTKFETLNFGTKGELQKIEEIINKKL